MSPAHCTRCWLQAVLLPLGFVRVRIPDSAVGEVELVQHLATAFLRDKRQRQRRAAGQQAAAPAPPLVAGLALPRAAPPLPLGVHFNARPAYGLGIISAHGEAGCICT